MAEAPLRDSFGTRIREEITRMARSGELAEALGLALAAPLAQQQGVGLGIQNIRRGVAFEKWSGSANFTVDSTDGAWRSLDPVLSVDMLLSGRPLFIGIGALVFCPDNSAISFSARLRGSGVSDVTGVALGMPSSYNAIAAGDEEVGQGKYGFWVVMTPPPGRATIEAIFRAENNDGTVFADIAPDHLTPGPTLVCWEL